MRIILLSVLLAMAGSTVADELVVQPIALEAGAQAEVAIELENPERAYIMTEFYMSLPEGISIAEDEDGELLCEPSPSRFDRTHSLVVELGSDGLYHFLVYSSKNKPLKGSSGALLTMTLQAGANIAAGQYEGRIFGQVFSDENKTEYNPADVLFTITVGGGGDITQTLTLAKGWNWVSVNRAGEVQRDSRALMAALGDKVQRLVGQTDELVDDPQYGLTGGLQTLDATASYKLLLSEDAILTLTGAAANPADTPVRLHKGWNWLGYVPVTAMPVATALQHLQATDGDRLVCHDDFAVYNGGTWSGSLTTMEPGKGYMYLSGKDTEFRYP